MHRWFLAFLLILLLPAWAWGQALSRREAALVNPLEYGTTCTTATLNAAISATPAPGKVLMLTPVDRDGVACTWAITSHVFVPAHIVVHVPQGVTVAISSGIILTLARYPREDNRSWKTGAGTLVIQAAPDATRPAQCEGLWRQGRWHHRGYVAIQAALNATLTAGSKSRVFPDRHVFSGQRLGRPRGLY